MNDASNRKNAKRLVAKSLSAIALAFGIIFFFMPVETFYHALVCVGSFLFGLICGIIAANLDDKHTGYWPTKLDL